MVCPAPPSTPGPWSGPLGCLRVRPLPSSPTPHLPGRTQTHILTRWDCGHLRTTLLTSCPSSLVTALCRAHGLSQAPAALPARRPASGSLCLRVCAPDWGLLGEACPIQLCTPVLGIALKQSFLSGASVPPGDAEPCLKHFWC